MSREESIVCLVRHGATSWNAAGRLQGRSDIPLSPEGALQAEKAGQALARKIAELGHARWDALYSSPLQRAMETAWAVGRWVGLTPHVDPGLIERAFGVLEGLTREEAEKAYPQRWQRPHLIPGLEDAEALRARAVQAVERLARAHRGKAIIVISHGAFINAFLRASGAVDPESPRTPLMNCSLTTVAHTQAGWRAIALNESSHLGA